VPLAPTATPGLVTIYLCGATVQGSPHIGHMRSGIAFDVLRRWLERSGQEVRLIRNVTDIDDKILSKSTAAEPPVPWWAWAQRFEREFDAAYRALGVAAPTYEPRATGHIPEMIDLVQRLLDAGHAYIGESGNVYYDVRSLPDYGSLTNQRLEDLATTEDESQLDDDVEADKRDLRDFALWTAAKPTGPTAVVTPGISFRNLLIRRCEKDPTHTRCSAWKRRTILARGSTAPGALRSKLKRASGKASNSSSTVGMGSRSPTRTSRTAARGSRAMCPSTSVTRARFGSWKATRWPSAVA